MDVLRVLGGLELLRLLPETRDDRVGELLGADLLFRDAFGIDVVGVHAVFDRPQPRVVRALRGIALPDVHQHEQRTMQQPRRIG